MAQIVHDLAPGAKISFATAFARRNGLRRQHQAPRRRRRLGDRRRRRLLRRAVLPGRPGRGRDQRSRRQRRLLLLGRRQRQPVRGRQGHRLLGNAGLPRRPPPAARRCSKPRPPIPTDHCLDFDPGAGEDDTFGITVEKDEELTVDRAVGRTVERGQSRHRRLSARRDRQTAARRDGTGRQHREQRRPTGQRTLRSTGLPAAGRVLQLGKQRRRNRSAAGDQPLLQHQKRGGRRKRLQPGRRRAAPNRGSS